MPLAYVQWIALMVVGVGLGAAISWTFAVTLLALWVMGCIYNIPPVRTKDSPYVDVLSESINNPLRMLAGWFIVDDASFRPASLLLSYWMVGCYFMAIKRYAEYRDIDAPARGAPTASPSRTTRPSGCSSRSCSTRRPRCSSSARS